MAAEWWVSFGAAVPFWSSSLVVARHLPHGRSPGGDRHLNFYGNRDNLLSYSPASIWSYLVPPSYESLALTSMAPRPVPSSQVRSSVLSG